MTKEQKILGIAYNYTLEKSGVSIIKLEYYLNEWEYKKPENLNDVFKSFLISAQNSGGMPNFIGKVDNLRTFLFDYSAIDVKRNYRNWENLFDCINNSSYKTPSLMNKKNNRNSWVKYCKSIIDISNFLSRFSNLNEFQKYVNQFINKENSDLRIALPLIIKEEIFNIGFALACDFIKENVSPEFIKPDTHINDIFIGIGICEKFDNDYEIFRKVITFSEMTNKKPYWIDKLFWLIGSRRFYVNKKFNLETKFKNKSSKQEFIEIIKNTKLN